MAATVLLEHRLGDGSVHYDWMVERAGTLLTFRVAERIDSGDSGEFWAEKAPDHRVEYLTYEGPISGGRGVVARVAEGAMEVEEGPRWLRLLGRLGNAEGVFSGEMVEDGRWRFRFVTRV